MKTPFSRTQQPACRVVASFSPWSSGSPLPVSALESPLPPNSTMYGIPSTLVLLRGPSHPHLLQTIRALNEKV